jgi:pimeloyl-ACP methyl ester carboxylesterase
MACLIALPRVGEAAAVVVKKYPRIMLRNMFADQRLIPDRLLEIAARDVARRSNIENYLKALRGLINLHGIRPDVVAEIHAAARRIIAPTLIVWGDRDRVVPSEQAPVVARNISGSQLHMMLGLGHVPFIEATETFNRKIMAFLSMAAQPVPSGIAR